MAQASEGTIIMLQIEHIEAARNIDAILKVPGINVICIGPTDLSGSVGVLRQFDHPVVVEALEHIVARSRKKSIPVCMGAAFPVETMTHWAAKGATFVLAERTRAFAVVHAGWGGGAGAAGAGFSWGAGL